MIAVTRTSLSMPPAMGARPAEYDDLPVAITPTFSETEPNNFADQAQLISRADFGVSANPNLARDTLPSVTIDGSISSPTERDYFRIELTAGELIIIDVDGVAGGLDAFVSLLFQASTLIDNDDLVTIDPGSTGHPVYGHNTDSFIQYRVPYTGTYYVAVCSFEGGSSGTYALNLSIGPQATAAEIHEENIQALLSGLSWSGATVTYGFPTSAAQYGSDGTSEIAGGFSSLTATQINVVQQQLGSVAAFTNLGFSQSTASPGTAQMRFARSGEPDTAHAYMPGPGNGGDSWYNSTGYLNPQVGNYAYLTFLHETGHALGLEHGHESPTALGGAQDSLEYSVMTYRSYVGQPPLGYANETFGYPQSYMMYDIAALQRVYGADFTTNSGDTVYGWNYLTGAFSINGEVEHTPGANRVFMTVWDGGGVDTYDLSNYANGVTVNLAPGAWTTTSPVQLANLGNGNMAVGNIANALLYNDDLRSLIENAVGGAGNDRLYGNQASNSLYGGAGNDLLDGRGSLESQGNDLLVGGLGSDVYYAYGRETIVETIGEGFDTIYTSVTFGIAVGVFVEQLGTVDWRSLDPFTLAGNELNNSIIGNNGHNAIYGGGGDDSLRGMGGNDVMDGQAGTDYLIGGLGDDIYYVDGLDTAEELAGEGYDAVYASTSYVLNTSSEIEMLATLDASGTVGISLSGNQLNNYIVANNGDNILDGRAGQDSMLGLGGNDLLIGGSGVDYMIGGTGNDNYYVDSGDTVDELANEGFDSVYAGASYALTANSHVELIGTLDYQSTAALDLTGNDLAQSIIGGNGANVLLGLGGSDSINGLDGDDRIDGGAGQDYLQGGAGADIFAFTALGDSVVATPDTIVDFLTGTDRIDLSAIDADSATATDDVFTFIGANAFTGQAGQLRVEGGNGVWDVYGDTNGDRLADFRITVYGSAPVQTDFTV